MTAHITSSVGWFGAVVVFLLLALVGFRSDDEQVMRSVYIALEVIGWYVIVPFSAASLFTGLIQSAGTRWGFVQHYWVLSKLVITVGASLLLLLHMQVVTTVAQAAATGVLTLDHLRDPRTQLVGDAAAAAAVLGVAIVLSVFKPEGRTPFGSRAIERNGVERRTPMAIAFWSLLVILAMAIIVRHFAGGMQHH